MVEGVQGDMMSTGKKNTFWSIPILNDEWEEELDGLAQRDSFDKSTKYTRKGDDKAKPGTSS